MKNRLGFTLIELLVVVLIIGILAGIAVPQYQVAVGKTRTGLALAALEEVHRAEEIYFMANGAYTLDLDALDIEIPTKVSNYYTLEGRVCGMYWIMVPKDQTKLPRLETFGRFPYACPGTQSHNHLVGQRHCIADTKYISAAICKAMGGRQDTVVSYRFYLE